jgi:uncharacterized protein YoxC
MTASFVVLAIFLIRISAKVQGSIFQVQTDLNQTLKEVSSLSSSLNEFVKSDLHKISEETGALIGKLTDLTSDINNKSHSLNFLFKPFSFLTSKMNSDSSSSNDFSSKCETIPQILKWIATSIFLIKTTREVVKKL